LTARIRQMRRATTTDVTSPDTNPAGIESLQARIADLEKLVQGLQDAVYRESQRNEKRITELEARVEPSALAVALSKDARDRGL